MPIFRKKPIMIEAWQFDGGIASAEDIAARDESMHVLSNENGDAFIIIDTLEGRMTANPGDWVIRGVQGEFYPCKPDIFAATYDHDPAMIEADAHLIAAAPDLLAALRGVLRVADRQTIEFDAARAAIAKAIR